MDSSKKIGIIGILLALIVAYFMAGSIFPKKYVETAYFTFQMNEGSYNNGIWLVVTEEILFKNVGQMGWKVEFWVYNNYGGHVVRLDVTRGTQEVWSDYATLVDFRMETVFYESGEFHFGVGSYQPNVEIKIVIYEWKSPLPFM